MFFRVKGTADNFDMFLYSGVRNRIESHLKQYNFLEIETPILESVSLFERGLGYETDVVTKQMFILESKGDAKSEKICLRPEATAGTMRAFLEKQATMVTPAKLFSSGSMFRYERPQKGRLRQFHQLNLEMIGTSSVLSDVNCIKMLHVLFTEIFTIETAVLKVNFLGEPEDRKRYQEVLYAYVANNKDNLCETCVVRMDKNLMRMLDCKSESCQKIYQDGPKLHESLSEESAQEWELVQKTLHALSVTFVHDPFLVRGLDYYNKTVFEFSSVQLGAQSAFCGGGRYDGLAQQLGSKNMVPAFGAAVGMERLLLLLEDRKEQFSEKRLPLVCVIPFSQEQAATALLIADSLQGKPISVDILIDDMSIKNKMKKANKLQASYVLLIGEDEQQNNSVMVKNMITGNEEVVLQSKINDLF